jgi:hypothetical protein
VRVLLAALLLALSQAAAAQVELLYVAAGDCGFCRRWEAQYLDGQKPKAGLDWSHVRFTVVDIGSFRNPYGAREVPERLRPGMEKILQGRTSLRGTPWFAVFVDGEVRAHGFGTNTFESRIQPALRAALHAKT